MRRDSDLHKLTQINRSSTFSHFTESVALDANASFLTAFYLNNNTSTHKELWVLILRLLAKLFLVLRRRNLTHITEVLPSCFGCTFIAHLLLQLQIELVLISSHNLDISVR